MSTLSAPSTAQDVASLLGDARRHGRQVVPTGAGTKVEWHHAPYAADAALSTQGLVDGFAHYAGDLVATIPAGMTLATANARLAAARQWLPLDPSFPDRATIGGIVAVNDSGPRRHHFGAPRDLIVGIEVALADGRVVHAGGRVVKNVAGYDLSRLFTGAHGSLGVITSATFKLAPMAATSRTIVAHFPSITGVLNAAHALAHSLLTPSAVELQAPAPHLLVRFETTAVAGSQMTDAARALIAGHGGTTRLLEDDEEHRAWVAHEQLIWPTQDTVVKVSVVPTGIAAVVELVRDVEWAAIGRAALGVLYLRLAGSPHAVAALVATMRATATTGGGHLQVLQTPDAVRSAIPPAAAAPGAAFMRAVKQQFDPSGVLRRVPDGV